MTSDISLRVGRMHCDCLVPRRHPDPEQLRWRVDGVAREQLVPALRRMAAEAFDASDPSVWHIRRLSLDITLDAGALSDGDLGRAWSSRVLASVERVISGGGDGVNVLYYPDRAAFLAQFALDLARERAWQQWQYAEFDSLRSLPSGTAVVEALLREPEQTGRMLHGLRLRGELERVLAAMSDAGAARVCASLAGAPSGGADQHEIFAAFLALWPAAEVRPPYATPHNALRLWSLFRARFDTLHPGEEILTARHLLNLADMLRRPEMAAPRAALGVGDARPALASAQASGNDDWAAAVRAGVAAGRGAPGWLGALVERLADPAANDRRASRESWGVVSPFAGVFALLPSMVDLGLDVICEAGAAFVADAQARERFARGLRLLVALKCFGAARAREAWWNEALRLAMGADAGMAPDEWPRFEREPAEACYRALAQRLAARGEGPASEVRADWVTTGAPGGSALVLSDAASGLWLWAARVDPTERPLRTLARGLRFVRETSGRPAGDVRLRGLAPYVRLPAVSSAGRGTRPRRPDAENGDLAVRRGRAAGDLAFFSLAPTISLELDLCASVLARDVLALFTRRLLGFERSSAAYAHRNFLEGTGSVTVTPEEVVAQLPGCPLQMILRLSGLDGLAFDVPWMKPRRARLSMD